MKAVKPHLPLVLTAALLVSADAPKSEADKLLAVLTGQEQQALVALRDRDAGALKRLLADDYHEVGFLVPGRRARADVLAGLANLRLSGYTPDDVRVVPLSKDAALLTYQITPMGSFKGKDLPAGPAYVSSAWAQRGGRWVLAFRQATPAGGPAPPVEKSEKAEGFEAEFRDTTLVCAYRGPAKLEDVNATLTVRLGDGGTLTYRRYWGSWQPDEVKDLRLTLAGVANVERADLDVTATRGGKPYKGSVTVRR